MNSLSDVVLQLLSGKQWCSVATEFQQCITSAEYQKVLRVSYSLSHKPFDSICHYLVVLDWCFLLAGWGYLLSPASSARFHDSLFYARGCQLGLSEPVPVMLYIGLETPWALSYYFNFFNLRRVNQVNALYGHSTKSDCQLQRCCPRPFSLEWQNQSSVGHCLSTLEGLLECQVDNISRPNVIQEILFAPKSLFLFLFLNDCSHVVFKGAWLVKGRNQFWEYHVRIIPLCLPGLPTFVVGFLSRKPVLVKCGFVEGGPSGCVPDHVAIAEMCPQPGLSLCHSYHLLHNYN